MSLINKLTTQGSTLSQFDGASPGKYSNSPGPQSRLHYEYSINDNPHLNGFPQPSQLDLDGKTPSKYLDNPPK